MRCTIPTTFALISATAWMAPAAAQTTFGAVQPNETKATATPAFGMVAGDRLAAGSGCGSPIDAEIFHVRTAPLAPGLYRHRLAPAFPSQSSHYPTLLGRTQLNSIIDPSSTVVAQQSTEQTSPSRFLQWYGFGEAEELYVDLDDASLCRTTFQLELVTTPITPTFVSAGVQPGGTLHVSPTTGSPTTDLDFWLFDADFDALPGSGTRSEWGATALARAWVGQGTFFVGVSQGPLLHHQAASAGDIFDSDHVLDFRGAVASSRREVGSVVELAIGAAIVQATFTEPFEILWFQVDVGTTQNATSFCPGDGTAGACPCGPSTSGQGAGCRNSTGRGARLFAHSKLETHTVSYSIEDAPPGAAAVLFVGLGVGTGTPVFAGNSCMSGTVLRLGPFLADALGRADTSSGSAFFNAGFLAGTTVYAQAAYRDAAAGIPCHANFTNGSMVTVR